MPITYRVLAIIRPHANNCTRTHDTPAPPRGTAYRWWPTIACRWQLWGLCQRLQSRIGQPFHTCRAATGWAMRTRYVNRARPHGNRKSPRTTKLYDLMRGSPWPGDRVTSLAAAMQRMIVEGQTLCTATAQSTRESIGLQREGRFAVKRRGATTNWVWVTG
jgi:hypothetical protein